MRCGHEPCQKDSARRAGEVMKTWVPRGVYNAGPKPNALRKTSYHGARATGPPTPRVLTRHKDTTNTHTRETHIQYT